MTLTITTLLAFAFAMFILVATPGPAFFVLTTRAISSGRRAGAGVVVGITIADLIYFTLALAGMTSLSASMGSAFVVIKFAGALYLIWLGVQMWRKKQTSVKLDQSKNSRGFLENVFEGLAVNLTNPKAIIFFAALLPGFVNLSAITFVDALILMLIITAVGGFIDLIYVLLAAQVRHAMQSPRAQRVMNRIGATVLVGAGVSVAGR